MWGQEQAMPKKVDEMSAKTVGDLAEPGLHNVGGVPGLHLQVQSQVSKSWILRAVVGDRRKDIGLGGFPDVSLAKARERAREAREQIRRGVDPVQQTKTARLNLRAEQAKRLTFSEATRQYIASQGPSWSNPKHAKQVASTLETYAHPVIGELPVNDIELPHIIDILRPIWTTKTETASRVRGRIEGVLDWATVGGYRSGLNPARWRGHLDKVLPKPSRVSKVEHHEALPYAKIGKFMAELRKAEGTGARALEFVILNASRSGEVRGADWSEVDLEAAVWTVPAARMKSRKEHRVPLSSAAVALLKALPRMAGTSLIFPGTKRKPLSDMTLTAVMRRMRLHAVPHGFRSTFSDWVSDCTSYDRDTREMALSHPPENKIEAAYRRGDLFEKRRRMMEDWATFLSNS
jgi:integrase